MSWSTRTWQPPVRRDGPLIVAAAFFLLPGLFFFIAWYADYFPGPTATAFVAVGGGIALLGPALLCFRLAARAGRRKALWSVLVLGGSNMSLWLPAQYLVLDGPLPPAMNVAIPVTASHVMATTFVALVPLLMGMIPVILYGLAPGQDRPLAGVPPRGAVALTAVGGIVLWAGTLFLTLFNPAPPPLVPSEERMTLVVTVTRPPALPADMVPDTWSALLWRLHDAAPPGASKVSREDAAGTSLRLQLPAVVERANITQLVTGRGTVEIANAGDAPPASGATVSTSGAPLPGAEETLETVLTGEQVVLDDHWSGISVGQVAIDERNEAAILRVRLSEEGRAALVRLAEADSGAFLSLVVDNAAYISFPLAGAIEGDTLVIRRLEPQIARALAAVMRYGPLPLVPAVETAP